MSKVAVYGSLRKGLSNHRLLVGSLHKETITVSIPFLMRSLGGFPALFPCKDNNPITFEVYEVSDATMESLDRLEGYPSFYNRMKLNDDDEDSPWFYFIRDEEGYLDSPAVPKGDWFEYVIKGNNRNRF